MLNLFWCYWHSRNHPKTKAGRPIGWHFHDVLFDILEGSLLLFLCHYPILLYPCESSGVSNTPDPRADFFWVRDNPASLMAMAMACLRFLTLAPELDRKLPPLNSFITLWTFFWP